MSDFKTIPHIQKESEKNILVSLAEDGPSHHSKLLKDKIAKSSPTISTGIHSLQRKGLVSEPQKKQPSGRGLLGRKREVVSATDDGLVLALFHGAEPDKVLTQAYNQKILDDELEFLSEMVKILGKKHTLEFFDAMRKGDIYTKFPKSKRKLRKIFKIITKHPKLNEAFKQIINLTSDSFKDFLQDK